jgi:hypothetical protein
VGVCLFLKATPMTDVTRILPAIEQDDPKAAEGSLPETRNSAAVLPLVLRTDGSIIASYEGKVEKM